MANILQQLSEAVTAQVAAAAAFTVRVDGRRRLPASGIVWSAEGVIVTAHHVVTRDDNLDVGLPDGSVAAAMLVGRDPRSDIAVLEVEETGLAVPQWTDEAAVAQIVLAVGRPRQPLEASLGTLSAIGGGWRTMAGGHVDRYLQPDLVMYPGFSGGPLLDASGDVIGMNTSALLHGATVTLPAQTLRRAVDALREHGRIRRVFLGVGVQPVRLPAALTDKLDQHTGLLIMSVEPGSPAEDGGLLLGDTIVTIADAPVRQIDDLHAQLTEHHIGSPVAVQIVRGGQLHTLELTVGAR